METQTPVAAEGLDAVRAVADAILYEGYLLYPYRRSSGKNKVRWQFGVLLPPAWARAHGLTDEGVAGAAESWWQRTECLVQAPPDAVIEARVRFLQVQWRSPERLRPDGSHRPVDRLDAGGRLELEFDEAVPQEFEVRARVADLLAGEHRRRLLAPGGEFAEPITDEEGRPLGRVVRRRRPVEAAVTMSMHALPAAHPLHRLRIRVENAGEATPADAPRDEALRSALIATHTLLTVEPGTFLSLLDPPAWAEEAARECVNVHTFPVLAGEAVLSSPILLQDHPKIAPESPGDLHDATEIDELLALRTRTLTDAEKREARATDPRAAEILDRVETMPPEVMARLHGTIRERTWNPAGDPGVSPETDAVTVRGVPVAKGSRVRLRPRTRGTDPQDRFLDGRTALVEAVLRDVEGAVHLAVTVEDDPAADLHQWHGRFRYFAPGEVEPLEDPS
ncbi:hypothetical protein [Thermomonospora catenispora]|uniref:hypothetical protein n=1 Tax=Thermomonospora catenispora TaxID=2493090 RepID=UPI001124A4E3|nr:hypothetical protein [Thermomonospora catenispora]TNY37989.1 hypothetical protein EIO00_05300 [Thermomonospora catenispora]